MKRRVGQYLLDSVKTAGANKIFGVPGDFNLAFLDDIVRHDGVEWVGTVNELNGSYAADGYARIHGLGVLVTTFGVGELSAVNGIAGSYAERVPVIAITGAPTTAVEEAGKYIHHSLGEGKFDSYRQMFEPITTAQAYITTDNATTEIPRVINAAIHERRPVHIHLPIDVAMKEIEVDTPYEVEEAPEQDVQRYVGVVADKLHTASHPVIITGHEINSFHLHDELEQFANNTNIPVAQLSLGKGAFNEENEHYIGMFDGKIAADEIKDYINQSDAILNIGAKLTDSATASFSFEFDVDDVVMINHRYFKLNETVNEEVTLPNLLKGLNTIDYQYDGTFPTFKKAERGDYELTDDVLTQSTYFKMMQEFIGGNDILIAEQGTSFFGAYELELPKAMSFIGQPLWGSIGYTLPSTLGTQMADETRRNILLIGDGSLQLTVQELSTMIRQDIKPVIFIINNDGYTVERLIHGMEEPYNDIQMWDYKNLPKVFGGEKVTTHEVKSSNDLKQVFDEINASPDQMHFTEVIMKWDDAPEKLREISKAFAAQNE